MTKKKYRLQSEIVKLIIFKLFFLIILWQLCFAHPTQKELGKHQLYQHLTMTNNQTHMFAKESKNAT